MYLTGGKGQLKKVAETTQISYRQLLKIFSGRARVSEENVDKISCRWLGCHPCFVYGDVYFGDRIEKHLADLDAQLGTNVSSYCKHEYEVIPLWLLPDIELNPVAIHLIRQGTILLIQCKHCEAFSHAVPTRTLGVPPTPVLEPV